MLGLCSPAATEPLTSSTSPLPRPGAKILRSSSNEAPHVISFQVHQSLPLMSCHLVASSPSCFQNPCFTAAILSSIQHLWGARQSQQFSSRLMLIDQSPTYCFFPSFPCGSIEPSNLNAGPWHSSCAKFAARNHVRDQNPFVEGAAPSRDRPMTYGRPPSLVGKY